MLCYRVKEWKYTLQGDRLFVALSATSHPALTSIAQVLELAFPGCSVAVGKGGAISVGRQSYYFGTEGELLLSGTLPSYPALDGLLGLLKKVVSIKDQCEVTLCLDVYRTPIEGLPPKEWSFTQIGKLLSVAKYEGNRGASDQLAKVMHNVVVSHRAYRGVEAVVSVPPHEAGRSRLDCPHLWGERLADWLQIPLARLDRTRTVAKQRDVEDPIEARKNQIGSMQAANVRGLSVLVVDDFYTDGDTMKEAHRALEAAGAARVFAICGAKTAKGGLHGVA